MKKSAALACMLLVAASAAAAPPPPPASASRREIRFLVPNPALPGAERELHALVDRYNAQAQPQGTPPRARVRLVRRGEDFSSLRDLMALHLAGDKPELAVVECSELAAVERSGLAKPITKVGKLGAPSAAASAAHLKQSRDFKGRVISLPFQHTLPVLVANSALLARAGLPERLPEGWKKTSEAIAKLGKELGGNPYAIAVPLQGGRGLWIFEALANRPLWKREVGGIRANRDLDDPVRQLQAWVDTPSIGRRELTFDRALQDFVDQKAALLVTSLDALPTLARQASFKWVANPLPRIAESTPSRSALEHGSHLIVTEDSPEVQDFLGYLYSTPVAKQWTAASGFLPLRSELARGIDLGPVQETYLRLANSGSPELPRSTDPEIVRVRSEWIQALHFLFGEPARRLDLVTVLRQLDTRLSESADASR